MAPAGSPVRWFLLALLAYSVLLLAVSGSARADEPEPGPEFVAPTEMATEPVGSEPSPCAGPTVAEPYEGEEDPAAVQVSKLRGELQEICAAIADRLDESVERSWWIVTQLLGQQHEAHEVNEWLQQGADRDDQRNDELKALVYALTDPGAPALRTALEGVDADNPLPVIGGAEREAAEASAELVASVDASGEAQKLVLWFIAGLLVAGVAGYGLYRAFDRGT